MGRGDVAINVYLTRTQRLRSLQPKREHDITRGIDDDMGTFKKGAQVL